MSRTIVSTGGKWMSGGGALRGVALRGVALRGVVLAGLFAGLLWLAAREDYWGDEGFTVKRAAASWRQLYFPFTTRGEGGPFDRTDVWDFNPPLYYATIRLAAGAHPDRVTVRLFSLLPMIAAVWIMGRWIEGAFGRRAGVAALALAALSPAVWYFGHEARPYAMPLLVGAVSTALALRGRGSARLAFFLAAGIALTGCLMHFHFVFWVVSLGAVAGWRALRPDPWLGRARAVAWLGGLAFGSALAAVAMLPQIELFRFMRVAEHGATPLTAATLARLVAFPLLGPGETPSAMVWVGAGLQAALALAAASLLRGSPRSGPAGAGLILWLAPTGLAIAAGLLTPSPLYPRYMLFGLPGWLMTVGFVAGEAARRANTGRRLVGALMAGLATVSLACALPYFARPIRPPWKPALRVLLDEAGAADRYTVTPRWLNAAFAANAGAAPPGAYFRPDEESLAAGVRLWIVGEPWAAAQELERLEREGAGVRMRVEGPGMGLWEAVGRGADRP